MHCAHTAVGRWNDVNIVVKYSTKFRKLCIQLEWLNKKKKDTKVKRKREKEGGVGHVNFNRFYCFYANQQVL